MEYTTISFRAFRWGKLNNKKSCTKKLIGHIWHRNQNKNINIIYAYYNYNCFTNINSFNPIMQIPLLVSYIGKLRYKKITKFTHGHTANQRESHLGFESRYPCFGPSGFAYCAITLLLALLKHPNLCQQVYQCFGVFSELFCQQ